MSLDQRAGGTAPRRGRPRKYATPEEAAAAKRKSSAASHRRVGFVKVTVDVYHEDVGAVRKHARKFNKSRREARRLQEHLQAEYSGRSGLVMHKLDADNPNPHAHVMVSARPEARPNGCPFGGRVGGLLVLRRRRKAAGRSPRIWIATAEAVPSEPRPDLQG
jgi:hypothetical protein